MHGRKLLPKISSRDEIAEACEKSKVGGKKKKRGAPEKPKPKRYLKPAELRELFRSR